MSVTKAETPNASPTLSEMGIKRVHEISHYSLRQDGAERDILRIIYKRAKGSLLPYSRKYKFGRALKTVITDGGTSTMEQSYEISPFLLKAISELDSLVADNKAELAKPGNNADLKSDLLQELDKLDRLVREPQDLSATVAQIELLRKHVQSL